MIKTVAIVGNGRTRVYAPHDNDRMHVWTMNNHAMLWNRRTTAVFEMHPDALTADRYDEQYRAWLRQPHPFPIYMHDVHPEIPASVQFPAVLLFNMHKGTRAIHHFFTTTTPYCLALALELGYTRVELYGLDMETEDRQAHRDSVFFWLGRLEAHGVDIYIPDECNLFDEWVYPINTPAPPKRVRLR